MTATTYVSVLGGSRYLPVCCTCGPLADEPVHDHRTAEQAADGHDCGGEGS